MQIQQELDRFRADALYVEEHREELLKQYPERWVAILDRRVVGAAKDVRRLVKQLERKGIPPEDTYCRYLTDKDELLFL
jgi:hypothetical protein